MVETYIMIVEDLISYNISNTNDTTNLSIQYFRYLQTKITLNNCREVGVAPQDMNNMLFED